MMMPLPPIEGSLDCQCWNQPESEGLKREALAKAVPSDITQSI